MQAGRYNHIIEILKVTVTRNGYGEQVDTYTGGLYTRANVINLSSSRDSINNETFYSDTKQLTIHRYVNVTEFDHIKIGSKEYRIVSLIEDELQNHKTLNVELINE